MTEIFELPPYYAEGIVLKMRYFWNYILIWNKNKHCAPKLELKSMKASQDRLNTMNDIFRKYVFKYSCQLSPVQNFKAFLISNNDIVMKLYILDICQFYVAKNMRPKYEFHNKDDIVKTFIHHDTFYKIKFSHLF